MEGSNDQLNIEKGAIEKISWHSAQSRLSSEEGLDGGKGYGPAIKGSSSTVRKETCLGLFNRVTSVVSNYEKMEKNDSQISNNNLAPQKLDKDTLTSRHSTSPLQKIASDICSSRRKSKKSTRSPSTPPPQKNASAMCSSRREGNNSSRSPSTSPPQKNASDICSSRRQGNNSSRSPSTSPPQKIASDICSSRRQGIKNSKSPRTSLVEIVHFGKRFKHSEPHSDNVQHKTDEKDASASNLSESCESFFDCSSREEPSSYGDEKHNKETCHMSASNEHKQNVEEREENLERMLETKSPSTCQHENVGSLNHIERNSKVCHPMADGKDETIVVGHYSEESCMDIRLKRTENNDTVRFKMSSTMSEPALTIQEKALSESDLNTLKKVFNELKEMFFDYKDTSDKYNPAVSIDLSIYAHTKEIPQIDDQTGTAEKRTQSDITLVYHSEAKGTPYRGIQERAEVSKEGKVIGEISLTADTGCDPKKIVMIEKATSTKDACVFVQVFDGNKPCWVIVEQEEDLINNHGNRRKKGKRCCNRDCPPGVLKEIYMLSKKVIEMKEEGCQTSDELSTLESSENTPTGSSSYMSSSSVSLDKLSSMQSIDEDLIDFDTHISQQETTEDMIISGKNECEQQGLGRSISQNLDERFALLVAPVSDVSCGSKTFQYLKGQIDDEEYIRRKAEREQECSKSEATEDLISTDELDSDAPDMQSPLPVDDRSADDYLPHTSRSGCGNNEVKNMISKYQDVEDSKKEKRKKAKNVTPKESKENMLEKELEDNRIKKRKKCAEKKATPKESSEEELEDTTKKRKKCRKRTVTPTKSGEAELGDSGILTIEAEENKSKKHKKKGRASVSPKEYSETELRDKDCYEIESKSHHHRHRKDDKAGKHRTKSVSPKELSGEEMEDYEEEAENGKTKHHKKVRINLSSEDEVENVNEREAEHEKSRKHKKKERKSVSPKDLSEEEIEDFKDCLENNTSTTKRHKKKGRMSVSPKELSGDEIADMNDFEENRIKGHKSKEKKYESSKDKCEEWLQNRIESEKEGEDKKSKKHRKKGRTSVSPKELSEEDIDNKYERETDKTKKRRKCEKKSKTPKESSEEEPGDVNSWEREMGKTKRHKKRVKMTPSPTACGEQGTNESDSERETGEYKSKRHRKRSKSTSVSPKIIHGQKSILTLSDDSDKEGACKSKRHRKRGRTSPSPTERGEQGTSTSDSERETGKDTSKRHRKRGRPSPSPKECGEQGTSTSDSERETGKDTSKRHRKRGRSASPTECGEQGTNKSDPEKETAEFKSQRHRKRSKSTSVSPKELQKQKSILTSSDDSDKEEQYKSKRLRKRGNTSPSPKNCEEQGTDGSDAERETGEYKSKRSKSTSVSPQELGAQKSILTLSDDSDKERALKKKNKNVSFISDKEPQDFNKRTKKKHKDTPEIATSCPELETSPATEIQASPSTETRASSATDRFIDFVCGASDQSNAQSVGKQEKTNTTQATSSKPPKSPCKGSENTRQLGDRNGRNSPSRGSNRGTPEKQGRRSPCRESGNKKSSSTRGSQGRQGKSSPTRGRLRKGSHKDSQSEDNHQCSHLFSTLRDISLTSLSSCCGSKSENRESAGEEDEHENKQKIIKKDKDRLTVQDARRRQEEAVWKAGRIVPVEGKYPEQPKYAEVRKCDEKQKSPEEKKCPEVKSPEKKKCPEVKLPEKKKCPEEVKTPEKKKCPEEVKSLEKKKSCEEVLQLERKKCPEEVTHSLAPSPEEPKWRIRPLTKVATYCGAEEVKYTLLKACPEEVQEIKACPEEVQEKKKCPEEVQEKKKCPEEVQEKKKCPEEVQEKKKCPEKDRTNQEDLYDSSTQDDCTCTSSMSLGSEDVLQREEEDSSCSYEDAEESQMDDRPPPSDRQSTGSSRSSKTREEEGVTSQSSREHITFKERTSPIKQRSSPNRQKSSPIQQQSSPIQQQSSPIMQQTSPTQQPCSPTQQPNSPINIHIHLDSQGKNKEDKKEKTSCSKDKREKRSSSRDRKEKPGKDKVQFVHTIEVEDQHGKLDNRELIDEVLTLMGTNVLTKFDEPVQWDEAFTVLDDSAVNVNDKKRSNYQLLTKPQFEAIRQNKKGNMRLKKVVSPNILRKSMEEQYRENEEEENRRYYEEHHWSEGKNFQYPRREEQPWVHFQEQNENPNVNSYTNSQESSRYDPFGSMSGQYSYGSNQPGGHTHFAAPSPCGSNGSSQFTSMPPSGHYSYHSQQTSEPQFQKQETYKTSYTSHADTPFFTQQCAYIPGQKVPEQRVPEYHFQTPSANTNNQHFTYGGVGTHAYTTPHKQTDPIYTEATSRGAYRSPYSCNTPDCHNTYSPPKHAFTGHQRQPTPPSHATYNNCQSASGNLNQNQQRFAHSKLNNLSFQEYTSTYPPTPEQFASMHRARQTQSPPYNQSQHYKQSRNYQGNNNRYGQSQYRSGGF